MSHRFLKDVFAIFVGAALGTMLAHAMGWAWFLGILLGGAAGYVARGLAEPRHFGNSVQRAFRAAFYYYPIRLFDGGWKRIQNGLAVGIFLGSLTIMIVEMVFALLGIVMVSEGRDFVTLFSNHFLVAFFGSLALGLSSAILAFVVTCSFFIPLREFESQAENGFANRPMSALRDNIVVWHWYALYYPVLGFFLGLMALWRSLPRWPHAFFVAARFTGHFFVMFARFVHREDFSACGIYALVAATAIFLYVPNEPLPIALSALAGGIVGAVMRRIVLRFAFAIT